MHTNKDYNRAIQSGDNWRHRAIYNTASGRRDAQRANYHSAAHYRLLENCIALQRKVDELLRDQARAASVPVRVLPTPVMHLFCIQLVVNVHVSFRSVPRILAIVAAQLGILLWVPHFTTIIEWTLRLGLAKLRSAGRMAEPWVGILDFSIQCGKEKVLVVLRLPLKHFWTNQHAPTLADCETIAVQVRTDWNGETLAARLAPVLAQCGDPAYWLTDGGADLKAGLRLLPRSAGQNRKPHHMRDIGHVFANALRAMFEALPEFTSFLDAFQRCAAQVRQTEFAHLAPPRLRAKGRFQSLERVTDWFISLQEHLARYTRNVETSYQERLIGFFGWTKAYSRLVSRLAETIEISNNIQTILKSQGMNRASWPAVAAMLESMPPDHPFRSRVEPYLRRCLQISNFLGGVPLVVSDDVIETLFGNLKSFMGDGKISNFGRMALLVPALTGQLTEDNVEKALASVNTSDLRDYIKSEIPRTLLRKRRSQLRLANIRKRRKGRKQAEST